MSLPQIISGKGIAGTRFPRRNLQPGMALPEVLEDLPQGCAVGTKQYSRGSDFRTSDNILDVRARLHRCVQ